MLRTILLVTLCLCALGQAAPAGPPGPPEIEDAYRSSVTVFGRRRPVERRGWRIRFEKLAEQSIPRALTPGMIKRRYRVQTAQSGWCQQFLLTESVVLAPFDRNVKGGISVEPLRSSACKQL